jgi:type VI secretion system secreted protein Hcp
MALVDMFLKLDGVEGESKDASGKQTQIQIEGFRIGALSPRDSFTNQAAGAVRMSHLTIRAIVDKSTPKLFSKITKNEKIPNATLTCRKAGKEQFVFFTVTLSDVLVVRVEVGGLEPDENDVAPRCEFDLAYGKIEMEAKEQAEKGHMSGAVMFIFSLASNA